MGVVVEPYLCDAGLARIARIVSDRRNPRVLPIVASLDLAQDKDQTRPGKDDVDDVGWFTKDNLPEIAFASTYTAIQRWLAD